MTKSSSTVNIKWINSTKTVMAGVDSRGAAAVIGVWPEHDPVWTGLKASDMLLMSAAACSAYDVVNILIKQREPLESLEVLCTGEQETEPPKRFTHIHLEYQFRGQLDHEKIEKAIRLSMDKYCTVINTLRNSVEITRGWEIVD